jgi:hypothetical protein
MRVKAGRETGDISALVSQEGCMGGKCLTSRCTISTLSSIGIIYPNHKKDLGREGSVNGLERKCLIEDKPDKPTNLLLEKYLLKKFGQLNIYWRPPPRPLLRLFPWSGLVLRYS